MIFDTLATLGIIAALTVGAVMVIYTFIDVARALWRYFR